MDPELEDFIESQVTELEMCLKWVYFSEGKLLEKVKMIGIEVSKFCEEVQVWVFDKFFCAFLDIGQRIQSFDELYSVWGIFGDLAFSDELKKSMKNCLQGKLSELLCRDQCNWNKNEIIENYLNTLKVFEGLFKTDLDFNDFFENFVLKFVNFIENFAIKSSLIYPVLIKILEMPLSKLSFQEVLKLLQKHSELMLPYNDLILTQTEISPAKSFKSLNLHHFQGYLTNSQRVSVFKYSSSGYLDDFIKVNEELFALKTLKKHEFPICIPKYYDFFNKKNQIWIIQEYLKESLMKFIQNSTKISEKMISMLPELIRCFCHLNNLGIFHGCLRPDSIFFDEEFGYKLNLVGSVLGRTEGKNLYSALWVENEMEEGQGMASDVFSLGIILLEIFTGYRVNEDFKFSNVSKYLVSFTGPKWVKSMICTMMENKNRPSKMFNEILANLPDIDTLFLGI